MEFYGKKGLALWKKAGEVKDKIKYVEIVKETEDESLGWGRLGTVVVMVSDDSVAAAAGLKSFCKIVSINGEAATEQNIPTLIKSKTLKVGILTVRKDGGHLFTFGEFIKFYGPEKGKLAWKKAAARPKQSKEESEKKEKTESEEEKEEEVKKEEEKKEGEKKEGETKEEEKKEEEKKEETAKPEEDKKESE